MMRSFTHWVSAAWLSRKALQHMVTGRFSSSSWFRRTVAVYTPGNGTHICFNATSRDAVDAFHRAALAQGGRDAGQPGPRPGYPVPDVYTCFVKDPFGNKLEAIHNGFSPRS
jgi:catechol 2,3-dioxygenase-like lactoylglutathione lyase family enzyme